VQRLLDGEGLLAVPRLAVIEGAESSSADTEQRVELLDGRVGTVGEDGAALEQ
jgi:hypothetical protein